MQMGSAKQKIEIVSVDEGARKDTTVEGLGALKPVFAARGSVTAGNSSQTFDGAAFALIMSEKMVKELNIEPLARLVSCTTVGVEPLLWVSRSCNSKSIENGRFEARRYRFD